jgi:O-antigen ligase
MNNNPLEPHPPSSRKSLFYLYLSLPVLFIYSPFSIDPVLNIRYIALALYILIGITILCIKINKYHAQYFSGLPFFIPWLIYWLSSIVGVIWAHDQSGDGLFLWLQIFLTGTLTLVLTGIFIDQPSFTQGFLKLFIVTGFIALVMGMHQLMMLVFKDACSHSSLYNVSSLFAHKNIFAEIMILICPIALIASDRTDGLWKYFGWTVAVSSFLMILILMSKAVWISFAISLFIFVLLIVLFTLVKPVLRFSSSFRSRIIPWGIVLLLSFPCIMLLTKPQMTDGLSKQWRDIFNPLNSANRDRLEIWKKTLDLSKNNYWVGIGLGNWKIEILKKGGKNLRSENNVSFYQRPHNDYLWILSEQGIIALLAYLISFVGILFMCCRLAFHADHLNGRIFYLMINFSLTSYLIFSFFSFPKERIEHIVLLSFLITVIVIHYRSRFGKRKIVLSTKFLTALFALSLFAVFVGIKRYISELHVRKAYEQRLIQNWHGVVEEIDRANNCFFRMDFVSTPLIFYKGEAEYELNKMDNALADFIEAAKVSPYHIHVLNNLGACYEKRGDYDMAIHNFKKALALSVYFEDVLFNLSAVYYNQRDYDKALLILQKINPETKDLRYTKFTHVLVEQSLNQQIRQINDPILHKYLDNILKTDDWAYVIFQKSVLNQISYKDQLLLDILWSAEKIDKDTNTANKLRERYFTH